MDKSKIKGYLICESTSPAEAPVIVSSKESSRVIIKTTLQDGDVPNRNKRMYPKSVIEHGLQSDFIRERLATKSWFCEAGKIVRVACL